VRADRHTNTNQKQAHRQIDTVISVLRYRTGGGARWLRRAPRHVTRLSSNGAARLADSLVEMQSRDAQSVVIIGHTHTHTHTLLTVFSGTTQVSRYQKGKTNLDFTGARDSEWQWHQLGYMQVCTSHQTDNHASTPPLSFLQAGCPSCHPTNSVEALKAFVIIGRPVKYPPPQIASALASFDVRCRIELQAIL